jgi:hypothetical protein
MKLIVEIKGNFAQSVAAGLVTAAIVAGVPKLLALPNALT